MPLQIKKQNILDSGCDIIVNPTDAKYSGSGGIDAQIHKAAGIELLSACKNLKELDTGAVQYTAGFGTGSRFIIHTCGPVWAGGQQNEAVLLRACYVNALLLAEKLGANSIAFPLISSGAFGFPKDRVLKIATDAISDFLRANDSDLVVVLCIYDKNSYELSRAAELNEYLSGRRRREEIVEESVCFESSYFCNQDFLDFSESKSERDNSFEQANKIRPKEDVNNHDSSISFSHNYFANAALVTNFTIIKEDEKRSKSNNTPAKPLTLEEWLKKHDDTFAVTLLKMIDAKGMDEVTCYKKANIGRKTFWKIMNDETYKPSKQTVLAFAVALELSESETEQLLKTVGFSLSDSITFDLIVRFYITNGIYDIDEINTALFDHDQVILGCY